MILSLLTSSTPTILCSPWAYEQERCGHEGDRPYEEDLRLGTQNRVGGGVIINARDLRWVVDEETEDGRGFRLVEHMKGEVGRLPCKSLGVAMAIVVGTCPTRCGRWPLPTTRLAGGARRVIHPLNPKPSPRPKPSSNPIPLLPLLLLLPILLLFYLRWWRQCQR